MIARFGFMALAFTMAQECRKAEAQQDFANQRIAITSFDGYELERLAENKATISARTFLKKGQIEGARRILGSQEDARLGSAADRENSERRRAIIDERMKWIRQMSLIRNCDDLGSKCLGQRGFYTISLPPYKVAEPREVLRETPGCGNGEGKESALVPRAETKNLTSKKIARWRAIARQGSVFSCRGPSCITIMKIIPERETSSYGLAACLVSKVGARLGAPTDCVEIYRKDETGERYRAIIGTTTIDCRIGRPDFHFIIRGLGEESFSAILAQSKKALANEPFKLQAEIYQRYVLGVSDRRVSPILSGFRETITIRIDIETRDINDTLDLSLPDSWLAKSRRQSGPAIGTIVSTNILVNKQNTDRPSDWHPAADSQQQEYVSAIRAALKTKFSDLCHNAEWLDDRSLLCSQTK